MALLLAGVAVAAIWCWAALWLGPRYGFVDHPDRSALTAHERPAVPLGGVGIYLAVLVVAVMQREIDLALLAASSIVLVLGLVDDRFGLSPLLRLAIELGAGVVLTFSSGLAGAGFLDGAVTVALVVVAINAVNLFDGLDGLVGSTALVSVLGLLIVIEMRDLTTNLPLALIGALIGFLPFNWHKARVFLGDAGSYLLGLLIAYLVLASATDGVASVLSLAGVLGVFVIDLVATITRRALARRPLFEGDRSHLYDQLRDRGLSVPSVVVWCAAAQLVIVTIAVVVSALPANVALVVMTVTLAASLAFLAWRGFLVSSRV